MIIDEHELISLIKEVIEEEINKIISQFYISGVNYEKIAKKVTDRLEDMSENIRWKVYPQERPKTYTGNCIVMLHDGSIKTNVYWDPKDAKHDHSIWKDVKRYLNVEDLRMLKGGEE